MEAKGEFGVVREDQGVRLQCHLARDELKAERGADCDLVASLMPQSPFAPGSVRNALALARYQFC